MKNSIGRGLGLAFLTGVLGGALPGAMADPVGETSERISQFSGKPVPRFESLRYSTVNGRTGPSLEHPIAWRYERKGLPVLIVKECPDWRRVRDHEGEEVWIHARMLSSNPTGIIAHELTLKAGTGDSAEDVAILQAGVIVEILGQKEGMLKVRKDRMQGWIEQDGIWGADPGNRSLSG